MPAALTLAMRARALRTQNNEEPAGGGWRALRDFITLGEGFSRTLSQRGNRRAVYVIVTISGGVSHRRQISVTPATE